MTFGDHALDARLRCHPAIN